ncbi:uncharacterized protein A4U43_C01F13810 [Asparagus officinalis]|uniref:Uncharacterized protein n=1 Tax=Asparagus officinalis TaxID=4686 RepID=A0A5P1FPQ4_ASPOF|nr:uncharacterized protein A4U43_C01F13810 [Asparagus officinalis]
MMEYLIGTSRVDPRYGQEPDLEHRYQPVHLLDEVLDAGLHLSLRSYLVRGALVELEIYRRMEQVRTKYLKFLGVVSSLKAIRGVESKQAVVMPVPRAFKVNGLRRELEESNRKTRRLDEDPQERDRAIA